MSNKIYPATSLIGGGEGALDAIDGDLLNDKDGAMVVELGTTYFYHLDADSAAAESSPNVISPDSNAGDKRWLLTGIEAMPVAQNLLTNSDFGIWSNSGLAQGAGSGRQTDFNVSNLYTDADGSTFASWTMTDATMTDAGANLLITETGATQSGWVDVASLVVGKLYKVSIITANGTGAWSADHDLAVGASGGGGTIVATLEGLVAGAHGLIFKATATTHSINLLNLDLGVGETLNITSIYVDEVIPGCVGADALGPDGWYKKSGMEIFRQHNDGGTLTKDGSFYSGKMDSLAAGDYLRWPLSVIETLAEHYQRFAGRMVTFGAWVYATTASHAFLQLVDSDTTDDDQSSDSSSYHTGGSTWEWLEVTMIVSATTTEFRCSFCFDSTTVAYISQPMLVFGSSIGEGNFSRPSGEVIDLEAITRAINNGAFLNETINIEARTSGKIPKDVKGLFMIYLATPDAANRLIQFDTGANTPRSLIDYSNGNQTYGNSFRTDLAVDGTLRTQKSGTWSAVSLEIIAVEIR